MYSTFSWHKQGDTGIIRLSRPPSNAMNRLFFDEFQQLCQQLSDDSSLCALIITSQGRHFSSGADIQDLLNINHEHPENDRGFFINNSRCFSGIHHLNIPVVAAIKGVCLGSAAELALACHFRIAGSNMLMGFPESSFGLMPGCGGTVFLSEIMSLQQNIELLLRGRNYSASEALEAGLADAVVAASDIEETAFRFVQTIKQGYIKQNKALYVKEFFRLQVHEQNEY